MISCDVRSCAHNEDYRCKFDVIEIDESGKCFQCKPVSTPEETVRIMLRELIESIKQGYSKNGSKYSE